MDERYYSLDRYLKDTYGRKLYKLSLNGGMTCPNRDGTKGDRGCIFCSQGGSGEFAANASLPITEQIEAAKARVGKKFKTPAADAPAYIAYFQAYTNTYAPVSDLRARFLPAIQHPDVQILSIATRPDCLGDDVLDLLSELNEIKPVWVELGLQTIHEETARFIRRGYELPVFTDAVLRLRARHLPVIVHTMLALPGESIDQMVETMEFLNGQDIQGIKLSLLHILKGTDLATYYQTHPFWIPSMEEYFSLVSDCLRHLRPDLVIHRLTGDGPKSLLIAPTWTSNKHQVLNGLHAYLEAHDVRQGSAL